MNLKHLLFFLFISIGSLALGQETSVYKTNTGKKYHTTSCRYLDNSKTEITLEKAIQLELEACKVCKPKRLTSTKTYKPTTTNSSTNSTATQCTGKTKAGNRCKRKTKSASGRCYQH